MKISKLFHWLYAILMFLPIMVFLPNAFYYGFNKDAVAQEKTEQVPVYYDTNEVNTISDLVPNNIYTLTLTSNDRYASSFYVNIGYFYLVNGTFSTFSFESAVYPLPYITRVESTSSSLRLYNVDNVRYTTNNDFVLDFVYKQNISGVESLIPYLSICTRQYIKEYQPLTTNMSITDSMSYAWDSVWQNPLFSWTYDSFLTQPFLYITNLFNVPSTNTLVYCLSYWLNLSIIWLTFDVVMYVPLLVHRWLDKGIIE